LKSLFFILLSFLVGFSGNAQTYEWAFNSGGTDVNRGHSLTADASGNIYVTGIFDGVTDFDPSGNTANLTSNGVGDILVAKYDAGGNYLWAFNMGGTNEDRGESITTDAAGNVYVTGFFQDTADFDPSGNTANLISNGGDDIFVAKYDSSGNYLWAFNVGGPVNELGYSIAMATAATGDIYISGNFGDTVDFDPSVSTAYLTSNGFQDVYVAKYDAGGNYLWAFNVGGTSTDFGYSMATDTAGSGDIYVTGTFWDTADFDPSGNTAILISNGNFDIFIAKYDATGNYQWAFNIGGGSFDEGLTITDDASGNVYLTGRFSNTADFDPSVNTGILTSNGMSDIFVAKYDSSGNYLWALNVGGTDIDFGRSIITDQAGSGNVSVTGSFQGTADFDPSVNTANLSSAGSFDIFVAQYDANGNYLWAFNVGGPSTDYGYSIVTDTAGTGNVYITGSFNDTVDFDPSGNTAFLASNANLDIFIAKYSQPPVGIEQIVIDVDLFSIYPNPTTGIFTVHGAAGSIVVYDLFGRPVLYTNEPQVDMRSYPAGIYIVREVGGID